MNLYRIANSYIGKRLVGLVFNHMSGILPVKTVRETDTLVAFNHPEPSYRIHILLVPRRAVRNLGELNDGDQQFLQDLFTCVTSLVEEFELERAGYRLVLNGGDYQDIPQLHFHLISE